MLHPCAALDMLSIGENRGHFWFDNYMLGGLIQCCRDLVLHPCVALDMLSVGENRGHFWFDNYMLGDLIHAAGIWCCIHVWRWICSVLVKTGDTSGLITTR